MSKWQVIVFDLDDTLYPERMYVRSGYAAVSRWIETEFGLSGAYLQLEALFDQGIHKNTFNVWLEKNGLDQSLVPRLVCVYREHLPTLQPYPEAVRLLQWLRPKYRIGLVSDGYHAVQRRKFSALGLAPYFDSVVFSDELGRDAWKPSTKPFEAVLRSLSCDAKDSVYIGDNPTKDFLGARQFGMSTIWVRNPNSVYGHLELPTPDHAPDTVVESLAQIQDLLV